MNEPFDIIETASLTEKATLLSEKQNKYVFRVRPRANKIQIKQAIEKLFQKKVVDVNTCNYAGKKKRERRADFGRKPHWKKAIVTLAEGEKIDLVCRLLLEKKKKSKDPVALPLKHRDGIGLARNDQIVYGHKIFSPT